MKLDARDTVCRPSPTFRFITLDYTIFGPFATTTIQPDDMI